MAFDGTAQALSPSPTARLNRPTNAESAPRCTCGFASTRTAAHCGRSNNPHRMFQAPISRVALTASPAEIARRSLHHFMDVDNASAPRMKRIKHLSPLGPVGVLSLPCTTAVVLTPRLTGARPIKLTRPRCPSAWPHNARYPEPRQEFHLTTQEFCSKNRSHPSSHGRASDGP